MGELWQRLLRGRAVLGARTCNTRLWHAVNRTMAVPPQDHLPGAGDDLDVVKLCERFAALGYRQPATACYVRCTPQCGRLVDGLAAKAGGSGGRA